YLSNFTRAGAGVGTSGLSASAIRRCQTNAGVPQVPSHSRQSLSLQLLEQKLRVAKVGCVEPFRHSVVRIAEHVPRSVPRALCREQGSKTGERAKLQRSSRLAPGDLGRLTKNRLGFRRVGGSALQRRLSLESGELRGPGLLSGFSGHLQTLHGGTQ